MAHIFPDQGLAKFDPDHWNVNTTFDQLLLYIITDITQETQVNKNTDINVSSGIPSTKAYSAFCLPHLIQEIKESTHI